IKRMLAGSLMSAERGHVFWNGTFSDPEKRQLVAEQLPSALDDVLAKLRTQLGGNDSDLNAYLWFDQKYYLADDILVKSDRISMAHSVEVRPPFLDHRIVEFAAKLPAHLKIRRSQQKLVLSELRKDKLPHSILQGKKTGFDIPAHEWLRAPLQLMLMESLREGIAEYGEVFRGD